MVEETNISTKAGEPMRYNPPPNWPKPPAGWSPSAEWSPDPSWPPPPSGWQLWVEDGPAASKSTSALSRLESASSDDDEYFGDDRAWSEDSGRLPARGQLNADASEATASSTEVAAEELTGQHVGRRVTVKWDDEQRYDIGTIVAISADATAINVKLAGVQAPVSFPREASRKTASDPRLYLWN